MISGIDCRHTYLMSLDQPLHGYVAEKCIRIWHNPLARNCRREVILHCALLAAILHDGHLLFLADGIWQLGLEIISIAPFIGASLQI